jgi:hypothetical protein
MTADPIDLVRARLRVELTAALNRQLHPLCKGERRPSIQKWDQWQIHAAIDEVLGAPSIGGQSLNSATPLVMRRDRRGRYRGRR